MLWGTFYAIQIIEKLVSLGHNVTLELYGDGIERDKLAKMAQLMKQEEEEQITKLFNMDDVKALIAGVTKDELLGRG